MSKLVHTAPNPAPLSPLISNIRHKVARSKLPRGFKPAAMLDVGCGVYPRFIIESRPGRAVGIDRKPRPEKFPEDIEYLQQDFSVNPSLPFKDSEFDLISSLAVLEHIEPEPLTRLLSEIRRVLAPGGHFIATIPSGIGDMVLHLLSNIGLASKANLEEHQDRYNCRKITGLLKNAGFKDEELRVGRFELGMNIFIKAEKTSA